MNDTRIDQALGEYRRNGHPEALGRLFDLSAPKLFPVALNLAGNPADAEDLLQATYLAMIEVVDRYDPERPALPWLNGILTMQAKKLGASRGRSPDFARLPARSVEEPTETLEGQEIDQELRRAVDALPDLYRSVLDLVLRHDLRPAEIAARLGRAPGAVRTQLHRGVSLLRQQLPKGLALPAALLAFESRGLAAVRSAVVLEAAGSKPGLTAATGAGGLAVWGWSLGALLITAITVATLLFDSSSDTPPAPGARTGESSASSSVESATGVTRDAIPSERFVAPVPETPTTREPELPEGILSGEFLLPQRGGFDFATQAMTEGDSGDFEFDAWDIKVAEPGGIAPLPTEKHAVAGRPASPDCYLRSVIAFDPERIAWQDRVHTRLTERGEDRPETYLLKLARGGYAIIALQNLKVIESEETGVIEFRYRFNAREPRFGHASGRTPDAAGITRNLLAFDRDPAREAHDRSRARLVGELEREVTRFAEGETDPASKVCVRGVLSPAAASRIGFQQWTFDVAGFSFAQDARGDQFKAEDEYSFFFTGQSSLVVFAASEHSRSRVRDLGQMTIEDFTPSDARRGEAVPALSVNEGHCYLIRADSKHHDRFDLFQVLAANDDRWLIFRWRPLSKSETASVESLLREPTREVGDQVEIRIRGGADPIPQFRAYLDGRVDARGGQRTGEVVDLETPVAADEPHVAFIRGGSIPPGKRWIVERIEYEAHSWDPEHRGSLIIELDGKRLIEEWRIADQRKKVWTGRIALDRKAFLDSHVQAYCRIAARVRFFGRLEDE